MNSIRDAYEQVSYPHFIHPLTNPARLAAIGRLLGLRTTDPREARVLDIGCGSGINLLAMADRLPSSTFHGIDFAAPEIAAGQTLARQAGLNNVQLQQIDLLHWDPAGAQYDYIIAYGLFSWVPDPVKDRLLQICRQCLAPRGIACISYLTYPGCKQPESIRDLLQLRTENCPSPADRVNAAHHVLHFLHRAYSQLPDASHSHYLRDEVEKILKKDARFLLLDELGVERDPCYLLQFANWAAEHGLRYLGESEFHTMFLENLPEESARELSGMQLDRLETEQLIDYVVNRSFRCSLLVGPDSVPHAEHKFTLDASAFQQLCLKPMLQPARETEDNLSEARFVTASGYLVTLRSVPLVSFVLSLAKLQDSFTPFAEVLSMAQTMAGRGFSDAEQLRLCHDLLSLYARRRVDVSALAFRPPERLPSCPRLTPLNLAISQPQLMLIGASHEAFRIRESEAAICPLLNGTHHLTELKTSPAGLMLNDGLDRLLHEARRIGAFAPEASEVQRNVVS